MQALTLPAARGWRWLFDGFLLFRRKPLLLSSLVLGYWLSMALINAIPFLGQILGFVLIPPFSVSLMNACRQIDQDVVAPPPILFSGFHKNLQTLIHLGFIYGVVTVAILGVTALADDGVLFRLVVLGQRPDEATLAGGDVMVAGQLALLLLAPVMMANWYAPVLAAWHDLPAAKALFFSFVACLRNWRAFLVYILAIMVVGALVLGFLSAVAGNSAEIFSGALIISFATILSPVLYASYYMCYRDVFISIDENV